MYFLYFKVLLWLSDFYVEQNVKFEWKSRLRLKNWALTNINKHENEQTLTLTELNIKSVNSKQ